MSHTKGSTNSYKKLVSLDPDEYEQISQEKAFIGYHNYVTAYARSAFRDSKKKLTGMKSFTEWLETEI